MKVFIGSSVCRFSQVRCLKTKTPRHRRGVSLFLEVFGYFVAGAEVVVVVVVVEVVEAVPAMGAVARRARGRRLGLFDDLGRLHLDFGLLFLGLAAGHERRGDGDEGEGGRELLHFGVLLTV